VRTGSSTHSVESHETTRDQIVGTDCIPCEIDYWAAVNDEPESRSPTDRPHESAPAGRVVSLYFSAHAIASALPVDTHASISVV
jgi:hypothetical protein